MLRHVHRTAARRPWLVGAMATMGALACDNALGPREAARPTFDPQLVAVITDIRGAGAIGDSAPLGDGVNRQVFDFDAGINSSVVYGRLDYTDYTVLKPDGNYAHFVVGSLYPGTAILTFVQTSNTCVEFDGRGLVVNTGEFLAFRVQVCDNGSPGVGLDVFYISVPERFVTDGQAYGRGDMLSSGENTLSSAASSSQVITHMSGDGAIGDGAPLGGGVNRQVFRFEMGFDAAVAAGTLTYTDSTAIMADGRPATLVVGPSAPGTALTTFLQVSDVCVQFSGVGLVQNTGEQVQIGGRACDSGPGTLDIFALSVPSHTYARGDMLAWGDIAATVASPSP